MEFLSQCKARELVPLECEQCGSKFHRTKNLVCRSVKGTRPIRYCSRTCAYESSKQLDTFIKKKCVKCDIDFISRRTDQISHCSHSCANRKKMPESQKVKLRAIQLGKRGPEKTNVEQIKCERCGVGMFRKRHSIKRYCAPCRSEVLREGCRDREGMCRNRNSHAGWYQSPVAGRVWLESSWEVQCAQVFDSHNVRWLRPKKGFEWYDPNGIKHKYYPDFYLPDYDLYLDPKNPWERQKGAYKLEQIKKHHSIRLILLDKHEIQESVLLELLKSEPPRGCAPR